MVRYHKDFLKFTSFEIMRNFLYYHNYIILSALFLHIESMDSMILHHAL